MRAANFSTDVQDFLRILDRHGARAMLVGGQAVAWHGYPRFTKDIDLFYSRVPEDAGRLYRALVEFWDGPVPHVSGASALAEEGVFIQLGVPPNRIDLISVMGSVSFEDAWQRRISEVLEGDGWTAKLAIISKDDLIQAKRDAGRLQDLADIVGLGGEVSANVETVRSR